MLILRIVIIFLFRIRLWAAFGASNGPALRFVPPAVQLLDAHPCTPIASPAALPSHPLSMMCSNLSAFPCPLLYPTASPTLASLALADSLLDRRYQPTPYLADQQTGYSPWPVATEWLSSSNLA